MANGFEIACTEWTFHTCNQVRFFGKKNQSQNGFAQSERQKRWWKGTKFVIFLIPKAFPLSGLIADHLSLPDYSCSLPAFQTSSYLCASSCTETLPYHLYTAPEACSFYKVSKAIALPCTFTRNQLLINSQKTKILQLHVCICTWICIKYIYT